MSYVKRENIPGLAAGEIAVELDTGDIVAVSCLSKRVDAGVCFIPRARAVDAGGEARTWPDGRQIETGFPYSLPVERVDALTPEAVNRECMLAVLGEPLQGYFRWSEVLLAGNNIRNVIAAAAMVGPADPGAVL